MANSKWVGVSAVLYKNFLVEVDGNTPEEEVYEKAVKIIEEDYFEDFNEFECIEILDQKSKYKYDEVINLDGTYEVN